MAQKAVGNAYAPYSGYRVGAVVFTEAENAYIACNIENASYGMTVCAERVAIWKAVSEQDDEFQALVIAIEGDEIPIPCGACLQVMAEFEREDKPMQLVLVAGDGRYEIHALRDYLPKPFRLEI